MTVCIHTYFLIEMTEQLHLQLHLIYKEWSGCSYCYYDCDCHC